MAFNQRNNISCYKNPLVNFKKYNLLFDASTEALILGKHLLQVKQFI